MKTSQFNKTLVKVIVVLALLPLVPAILGAVIAASPLLIVLLALGVGGWLLPGFWRGLSGLIGALAALAQGVFGFLFGRLDFSRRSARFMGPIERLGLLGPGRDGLLVDGHYLRISEKTSFQSMLTVGGMGTGKSSTFVLPNLFRLDGCSFVISDTSGEIYRQTSGDLARRGYDVRVLNLMEPARSETYNPLERANSFTQVAQAAEIAVRSAFPSNGQDAFWNAGAEKIIRIFIQCLKNLNDPTTENLANVKYLIGSFDSHLTPPGQTSAIDRFVLGATQNDPTTYNDYRAFLNGNQKAMTSFLTTADTALSAIGNPDIASLTATNSIDFTALKRRKTALYVLVRQQDMAYFRFLLNLFYTDLFSSLMTSLNPRDLPVYLLLDEFGHLTIPNFDVFATTARKYRVGFWIFLQSLAQLESRYGRHEAETILDGLGTEIYLPGVNLDTARRLEARLGRHRPSKGQSTPLLSADEIIRMENDEALMLHSNRRPIKLTTRPFYKQAAMRRAAKRPPVATPQRSSQPVQLVRL